MKPIKVLFDTCVVIHLFNEHTELHEVAVNYYRYLKNTNNSLLVSPFSVDEYGVKDDITRIFAHGFSVPVYAIEHAKKAAEFAGLTYDHSLRHDTNDRSFIATDTRIIAQAVIEQVDYILTADKKTFLRTFRYLEEQKKVEQTRAIYLWDELNRSPSTEPLLTPRFPTSPPHF